MQLRADHPFHIKAMQYNNVAYCVFIATVHFLTHKTHLFTIMASSQTLYNNNHSMQLL